MGIVGFLLPLVLLIVFSVVLKRSLPVAAGASVIITGLVLFFYAHLPVEVFYVPGIDAFMTTVEFILLLFGVVFFTEVMKNSGAVTDLEAGMTASVPDKAISTLLLAWLFGSFIEGTAGFGTPALIIAPFLIAYGYKPYMAVCITLLANSVAVTFGAVGLPITLGFAGVYTHQTILYTALIGTVLAIAVPFLLLQLLQRFDLLKERSFFSYTGSVLLCGFCFAVPYLAFSFLGPEYPSLLGGLIGLIAAILLFNIGHSKAALSSVVRGFAPYMVLVVLLLLLKQVDGNLFTVALPSLKFSKPVPYIYTGYIFIVALFLLKFHSKFRKTVYWDACKISLKRIPLSFVTIFLLVLLSKLAPVAGGDDGVTAQLVQNIPESLKLISVVLAGLLGSFAAGSATVSNIMFTGEVVEIARSSDMELHLLLAMQMIGAAIGNVISFQNIAVVQASLNEKTPTGTLLKHLLPGVGVLVIITIVVGLLMNYLL